MSSRETREFVTPGGHKVVLNAYLTGREARELKEVMYAAMKVDMSDVHAMQAGNVNMGQVSATFLVEQEKRALGYLVVSVDGVTENALETLLDLPSTEYDTIVAQVNAIQNPTKPENSEQPGGGTSQAA